MANWRSRRRRRRRRRKKRKQGTGPRILISSASCKLILNGVRRKAE